MRLIDQQYLKTPFYGSRSMRNHLRVLGYKLNRKRIQRLMRIMGLQAIYPQTQNQLAASRSQDLSLFAQRPENRASQPGLGYRYHLHSDDPRFYVLGGDHDCYSRKVLFWRISNTLETDFCVEALQEVMARYGRPGVFITDQGAQFTSSQFTGFLESQDYQHRRSR